MAPEDVLQQVHGDLPCLVRVSALESGVHALPVLPHLATNHLLGIAVVVVRLHRRDTGGCHGRSVALRAAHHERHKLVVTHLVALDAAEDAVDHVRLELQHAVQPEGMDELLLGDGPRAVAIKHLERSAQAGRAAFHAGLDALLDHLLRLCNAHAGHLLAQVPVIRAALGKVFHELLVRNCSRAVRIDLGHQSLEVPFLEHDIHSVER